MSGRNSEHPLPFRLLNQLTLRIELLAIANNDELAIDEELTILLSSSDSGDVVDTTDFRIFALHEFNLLDSNIWATPTELDAVDVNELIASEADKGNTVFTNSNIHLSECATVSVTAAITYFQTVHQNTNLQAWSTNKGQ